MRAGHTAAGDAALLEALGARSGVICMVGAGGKKSTMYRLARTHNGRVAVTTTVHIPPFPDWLDADSVVADAAALDALVLARAQQRQRLAYATLTDKPGRYGGVAAPTVARLHTQAGFDVTLVKADGARRRHIKGPGGRSPIVPDAAATVILVVSALVAGKPLDQRTAHYADHIAELLGMSQGEILTAQKVAKTLAAYASGAWLPPEAQLVPLINMAEDRRSRSAAAEIATALLEYSPRASRVVIAHMQGDDPLVDVVLR